MVICKISFPIIYRSQSLNQLIQIEKTLEGINKIFAIKMVAKGTIKSERTDSPTAAMTSSVKNETKNETKTETKNDFQSPESPPMYSQDVKCDLEPITIPTERRDSNQYRYDSSFDANRLQQPSDHRSERDFKCRRDEDFRRSSHDRRRRSRSRSRSRSRGRGRSRSRSRSESRGRERKRYVKLK